MAVKKIALSYGKSTIIAEIPTQNFEGILEMNVENQTNTNETLLLEEAMAKPIGTARLQHLVSPGKKIAIVISDLTRPCPSAIMLPVVLKELELAGVKDSDIFIVIALGIHRQMTLAEMEKAVGPAIFHRYRIINHDQADTIQLGMTSAGTPVEIFRPVVEADFRICLGNLELHYFAGFSGGAKSIFPGVASQKAINANHAMMVKDGAIAGRLEGNPVRMDIEEAVNMLGVDFILNVIVDENYHITSAYAGHLIKAHRQGCQVVAQRGIVPIKQRADVVLVSPGGSPKDINFYQAQKALDNVARSVRDGGIIILVAECIDGFGSKTFEEWLRNSNSPEHIIERIQQQFILGGHKAAAIASVQKHACIYMVTEIDANAINECGIRPFKNVNVALAEAIRKLGENSRVLVIPHGSSVLPLVPDE